MLLAGTLLLYRSVALPSLTFVALLFGLSLTFWLVNRFHTRWLAIFIFAYCWAAVFAIHRVSENLPMSLQNQSAQILGCILKVNQYSHHYQRILIKVDETYFKGEFDSFKGKVSLGYYQSLEQNISPGWCGEFKAKLKPVHGRLNSRGFDYEAWSYVENIKAIGVLKSADKLYPGQSLINQYQRLRYLFSTQLKNKLVGDQSTALVLSLALGDRSMMTEQQWELLRRTGTSHLLAISGLHIGLVFWIVSMLISMFWRMIPNVGLFVPAQKTGWIGGLVCSGIYLIMTGFPLSGRRAWIMLFIASMLLLNDEKTSFSRCFATTLIAVLLIWPSSVLSIGFWFSFVAVALILLQFIHIDINLLSLRRWARFQLVQKLIKLVSIQLVLSIAILPLSVFFFGELSFVSPLANVIAIPLVSFFVLPLILIGFFLHIVGAVNSSYLIFEIVQSSLNVLSLVLNRLVELNWSWSMPVIYQYESIIFLTIGLLLWLYFKQWPAKWLLCFLLVPIFLDPKPRLNSGEFELTVFDVGQGLAIWLETSDNNILVDTGFGIKDGFNYFDSVILPNLKANGVKQFDIVVISHADADHAGGLPALLESDLNLKRIYSSYKISNPINEYCQSGLIRRFDGVDFEFLTQKHVIGKNNQSCVVRLSSQFGSLLLPGDIEKESELKLLNDYPQRLNSSVLIVPHHGSQTSSTNAFIKSVNPELAIISAGYQNRYGHPAGKIIARYQDNHIRIFNTACHGQITVGFYSSGMSINSLRQTNQPFWRHQCSTASN